MTRIRENLLNITRNPYANLTVGIILMTTCVIEIIDGIEEESAVGSQHGLAIFSLFHIIKTLPDVMETFEFFEKSKK